MDERKTPVVTSKYTWANAPLEWHSVYCVLLWIGAVRFLLETIVEIIGSTQYALIIIIVNAGTLGITIALAIKLRDFKPVAYKLLWTHWILTYLINSIAAVLMYGSSDESAISDIRITIIVSLVIGIPTLVYYYNRKSLFFSNPQDYLIDASEEIEKSRSARSVTARNEDNELKATITLDHDVSSKFTWGNVNLKWHNFMCGIVWLWLIWSVFSVFDFTFRVVYNNYVSACLITVSVVETLLLLALAFHLPHFIPATYRLIRLYWILEIVFSIINTIFIIAVTETSLSYSIGSLLASLAMSISNLIYYRNRRSLFYTVSDGVSCTVTTDTNEDINNAQLRYKVRDNTSEEMGEVENVGILYHDEKRCKKCGALIVQGALFCNMCGESIANEAGISEERDNKKTDTDLEHVNKDNMESRDELSNIEIVTERELTEHDIEQIRKWKTLLDEGIITQNEFDEKKKEILGI